MFVAILRSCGPWACSALLYALTAWPASAEPPPDTGTLPAAGFGTPVSADTLADARGGSFQTENHMQLTGSTTGNSAQNVATGHNAIESGAFDHMSGLPVVIQNSGANVLIQNAVIVNLQMQ